jgi:ABC-2 type transport system ATP-binding protein
MPEEQSGGSVVETRGLTVYYGKNRGVVDLDLSIREGEVFGFLGPNGAGKTTTQRVLLDVIRPTRGTAEIFGLDCRRDGPEIRKLVGYLPGELALYKQMTGRHFLDLIASMRPGRLDPSIRRTLCERLELDTSRRIGEYSRGNKQKLGVVAAFMVRPELLILDEPTTGLDPLKQQVVIELVREARAEGRTVFFSSHILQEVQTVCDRVGIIRDGRLVAIDTVAELMRQQLKRLRLTLRDMPAPGALDGDGVSEIGRDQDTITLEIRDHIDQVLERALRFGLIDLETRTASLEEIFLAYYGAAPEGGEQ